jgi:phage portal protein BeeE
MGGTLSSLVPVGTDMSVDLDAHSRPDESQRIADYAAAIAAGIYTVDEVRAKEGLPPLNQEVRA